MTSAKAVGQPDKMQALVDGVEQQIADQAAAHPEFAGQHGLVVTPLRGPVRLRPRGPARRGCWSTSASPSPARASAAKATNSASRSAPSASPISDQVGVAVWLDDESDPAAKKVFEQTTTEQRGSLVRHQQRPTAATTSRTAS